MTDSSPSGHPAGGGDGDGCKAPRARRRRAFVLLKLSGVVFALAVLAAVVLVVRLSIGPVAIDGIGDKIAAALQERFGGNLRFALGGTALVQRGLSPTLTVDKLSVTGPNGEPILAAPRAEVSIDPFALLIGHVSPKRLEVFGVTLRLEKLENGHLAIGSAAGSKPFVEIGANDGAAAPEAASSASAAPGHRRAVVMRQAAAAIRQVLDMLTAPRSAIAAVDRLGISDGSLVIADRTTHEESGFKGLDLAFDRGRTQTSFSVSAEGPSRRWVVAALASGSPGAARRFSVSAKNLSIDEVELAAGTRDIGVDSDMPFGAKLDIGLNPDNSLSEATGAFDFGEGFYRIDDPDHEPQLIQTIDGGFHWNAGQRRIEVDRLRYIESGGTHFVGGGTVQPPHDEGDPWMIDLKTTEPPLFAPDRKGQAPLPVESAVLAGRLWLDRKHFAIQQLRMNTAWGGLAALGDVDWANGPHIRFGMSMDPAPVALIGRLWPAFVAAPVRTWMLNHLEKGTIRNGRLKIDYVGNDLHRMRADRAPSDSSVALDFDVEDGRMAFIDGVPPVDHMVGTAHITGRTSRFTVTSGSMESPAGQTIDLTGGSFSIANANKHPIEAKLLAHLDGSVESVASVLSLPALKSYGQVPLDPQTLHGRVTGTLDKTIFLGTPDDARDVLKVDAKVTDFTAERLLGKENLADATVDIAVDDGKLKATGQGRMFGGQTAFEIDRNGFGTPTASVALTLDDAARAKLGLSAIQGVSGPIVARVNAALGDPQKMKAQVELDLSRASIAAAYLGLSKPAGKPGKVTFNLSSGPTRMMIDQLVADVGPFQARGAIDLAPDNSFQGAHFSSLKVSPGDDMKLDVTKEDDAYKLTIRGSTIDARPFLKAVTATPTNEATPISRSAKAEKREVESLKGLDVDLKAGILTGHNKQVMSDVDLKLSRRGNAYRQFSVQGHFGDSAVSAAMTGAQKIKISTTNAGALVSFIDLYKHMEDGLLSATMQLDDDQLSGYLEIHDFILRDEPAIRRLVAQSAEVSAPGADTEAARHINAGAVRFNRLKVSFQREGSQLELRDAAMSGPEIGLSVDGWLDYTHDRVDMKGTFVPAFALNNLFSQIPLFGVFLGGKSNEGLLAITFRITGLATSPSLTINPLSAVAPGILRNIFGALDDAAYRGQHPVGDGQFQATPTR